MITELRLYLKGQSSCETINIDRYKLGDALLNRFLLCLYYAETFEKQQSLTETFRSRYGISRNDAPINKYILFTDGSRVVKWFHASQTNDTDRRTWRKTNETFIPPLSVSPIDTTSDDIDVVLNTRKKGHEVGIERLNINDTIKNIIFYADKCDFACLDPDCPYQRTDETIYKNITDIKYHYKKDRDYIFPVTIIPDENGNVKMYMGLKDGYKQSGVLVVKDSYIGNWYSGMPPKRQIKAIANTITENVIADFNKAMRGYIFNVIIKPKNGKEQNFIVCADTARMLFSKITKQVISMDNELDNLIDFTCENIFNTI